MSHANLNRRAVLAGAAAFPAIALPTVPALASNAPDDPIFAAIKARNDALAAFEAFSDEDDPEYDKLGEAWSNTERNLVRTVPTTAAGIVALIRFVEERVAEEEEYFCFFMETGNEDVKGYHALHASLRTAAEALQS